MERIHHGRLIAGDRVVVEIEWAGRVRGEALGRPNDLEYRYTGLGVLELDGDRVRRQLLFGDATTLVEQLGLPQPASWTVAAGSPRTP